MRRAVEQFKRNNRKTGFLLQLTAMVDMFTILVVFLLKSYSTSAVVINPQEGLKLPQSSSQSEPIEALRLVVSNAGIFVDEEKILDLTDGILNEADTDKTDRDFIRPLYEALNAQAQKSKEISEKNTDLKFEGKIVLQADARLNYKVLKKVMYTSSMAGYADMKLATMAFE